MRFLFTGTSEGFHLSDEELWNIYGSRGQNDLLSNDNTQVIIYGRWYGFILRIFQYLNNINSSRTFSSPNIGHTFTSDSLNTTLPNRSFYFKRFLVPTKNHMSSFIEERWNFNWSVQAICNMVDIRLLLRTIDFSEMCPSESEDILWTG